MVAAHDAPVAADMQGAADPVAAAQLLEDVDFVVSRPARVHRPEGGPRPPRVVQLGANLDAALVKRHFARRCDFAGREMVVARLLALAPELEKAVLDDDSPPLFQVSISCERRLPSASEKRRS